MSTPTKEAPRARITTLEPARAKRLVGAATAFFAIGVALSVVAAVVDRPRFAFSYLTGFVWLATIGLGAMFFVLIQHLTKAGWSVIPRRQLEWLTGLLFLRLFVRFCVVLCLFVCFAASLDTYERALDISLAHCIEEVDVFSGLHCDLREEHHVLGKLGQFRH